MRMWHAHPRLCLFLLIPLVFAAKAFANPQLPTRAENPARSSSQLPSPKEIPPLVDTTNEQTKTEQYTLSHERYKKAVAYSRAEYTLYFASYLLGAIFLFLILRLGIAARFRDIAECVSQSRWVQGLVFVPLLRLLLGVLALPLRIYWHRLSLQYEQSVQGWGSWFWDWTKGQMVVLAIWLVLAVILFAVMRLSPRRWWFYFWFPAVAIMILLVVIIPLVIDPLFDKFEPLGNQHPDLVASVGKLTSRAGVPIPPERMFLMVASRKTNEINAYVTGLGASKRVIM